MTGAPHSSPPAGGPDPALVEPPPPDAAAVFGDRYELACRYADLLCTEGVVRGLIGPREPARVWRRHLMNGAALAAFVPPHARVVDVGSGAGLPGVPLFLARPDLRVTLVEPLARRVVFLELVKDALGLQLDVLRARAEQLPRGGADVVVARAVAPLARLVPLTLPLLVPGGLLLALKGRSVQDELAAADEVLARCGGAEMSTHTVGVGEDATVVVQVTAPHSPLPLNSQRRRRQGAR